MRRVSKAFSVLLVFFITASFVYGETPIKFSTISPLQGDTVVVTLLDKNVSLQSAEFDNQPAAIFKFREFYRIVFGIPAIKKPGIYYLKINFNDETAMEKVIKVRPRKFAFVDLGIPPEVGVDSKTLVKNLSVTNNEWKNIFSVRRDGILFSKEFGLPLRDNRIITSPFGEIRRTGNQEIRHLGTDIKAPLGAAIGAINGGIVSKAYFDAIYGNSIIIDHGEGIFSLYNHLDRMAVKEGDTVKKGTLIGTVGKSGYATAPHLHLSLKINNVSVDPLKFVLSLR